LLAPFALPKAINPALAEIPTTDFNRLRLRIGRSPKLSIQSMSADSRREI